jgi:hypothetical protein
MTETDQMNEMSFRSDEQAQSQDRERLQEDIEAAWHKICYRIPLPERLGMTNEIALLRWALGVK